MGCAAVPKSGCWVKGPALTSLSLTAEMELLNQVSIPAHFVALNGDKLNVNLKTGSEVRVSGSGCWGRGMGFLSASPSSGCFLPLTPSHPSSRA